MIVLRVLSEKNIYIFLSHFVFFSIVRGHSKVKGQIFALLKKDF